MVCSDFGIKILIALFIRKPSVVPVWITAFSVPTFNASCKPEPIFASLKPLPELERLPNPFNICSNCAHAGALAKKKNNRVAEALIMISSRVKSPRIESLAIEALGGGEHGVKLQKVCG